MDDRTALVAVMAAQNEIGTLQPVGAVGRACREKGALFFTDAAQAVGNACGANPIPVVIPCHRVLGASGLGGYSGAGGVETKVWLLRHEGAAGLLI